MLIVSQFNACKTFKDAARMQNYLKVLLWHFPCWTECIYKTSTHPIQIFLKLGVDKMSPAEKHNTNIAYFQILLLVTSTAILLIYDHRCRKR